MTTKTKTKKEIYWRCKKCLHAEALAMEGGDEHEFYACPVASPDSIEDPRLRRDFALLLGCGGFVRKGEGCGEKQFVH